MLISERTFSLGWSILLGDMAEKLRKKTKPTDKIKCTFSCRHCKCLKFTGYEGLDFTGIYLFSFWLSFFSGFRPLFTADFYCFGGGSSFAGVRSAVFHLAGGNPLMKWWRSTLAVGQFWLYPTTSLRMQVNPRPSQSTTFMKWKLTVAGFWTREEP